MQRISAPVVALVAVALVAAGAIGWAIRGDDSPTRMGPGMMGAGSNSAPGWWNDDHRGPGVMGMSGMVAVSGEPEYLVEMVAHHQEAVDAAGELVRSDRAEMREFGESIVTSQSAQIRQMQAWLQQWYPDEPTAADYRPMMRDLSGLSGDDLDRAFLEDMVHHHMVAVMMSQHLLRSADDGHDEVAALARTIRDDQHAEILQMQRWLSEWFRST